MAIFHFPHIREMRRKESAWHHSNGSFFLAESNLYNRRRRGGEQVFVDVGLLNPNQLDVTGSLSFAAIPMMRIMRTANVRSFHRRTAISFFFAVCVCLTESSGADGIFLADIHDANFPHIVLRLLSFLVDSSAFLVPRNVSVLGTEIDKKREDRPQSQLPTA